MKDMMVGLILNEMKRWIIGMNFLHGKWHWTSFQIIIVGFAALIIIGAVFLTLPWASQSGKWTSFLDALFTATSAVCVTGLVVHDTATYWSGFGQLIILILIQIGGMGVVTVAAAISMASGRKITLMQTSTMQEAIAAPNAGSVVRLTGFVLKMTALIELTGALLLMPVFGKEFGVIKGLWYAIFHSISAFCNAGFDLMGVKTPYSSLTDYVTNPLVNLTVMLLIIVGGLGFTAWEDLKGKWKRPCHLRMQTKAVLAVTCVLIVLPMVFFFFFEYRKLPLAERFWSALFQAVTPRTAGFNTADLSVLSEQGQLVTIMLMLVGGSPGSTAGGMKTTTLIVLLASSVAVFRRKNDACLFGRRIPEDTIRSAAAIFLMYISLFTLGGLLISVLEGIPLLTCMFETASAIGTVGLTLGITSQLGCISRMILISLMYFGRVGGLTLIFAAVSSGAGRARLPQEKVTVG